MDEGKRQNIAWSYKPASRRVKVNVRRWKENIEVGFEAFRAVVMNLYLLGYNAMYSVGSQLMLRRNMPPLFSAGL
jgi:hypothetical protein